MESFKLNIAGLSRQLPIVKIDENLSIASFVMMGDTELVEKCAWDLYKKLPIYDIDILVCPESKSIPLTQCLAQLLKVNYVVARKSIKSYMENPAIVKIRSITTSGEQILALNRPDIDLIRGRRICIIDDVVSTGGSITNLEKLIMLNTPDSKIYKASVLLEDGGYTGTDLIYLEKLPVFKN